MTAEIVLHLMTGKAATWARALASKLGRSVLPNLAKSLILFMDGASWHERAANTLDMCRKMGLSGPEAWAKHAPNSPDLQAPVEWAHSILKQAVRFNLMKIPSVKQPADVRRLVELTWAGGDFTPPGSRKAMSLDPALSADTCKAMFEKQALIYKEIIANGGDWSQKGR
jgi:hypothetical protein